jgi:hypothetical protein
MEATRSIGQDLVVFDGLNVVCTNHFYLSFEIFLTIVNDVLIHEHDVAGIFDANTRYRIGKCQGEKRVAAYLYLLENWSNYFVETTGGVQADNLLLPLAEREDALIISNDKYRDHVDNYPWVLDQERILKVCAFRDFVVVGERRLCVDFDLNRAMSKLDMLLSKRQDA